MARIQLSESAQVIVASERFSHPDLRMRCKMLALWWCIRGSLVYNQPRSRAWDAPRFIATLPLTPRAASLAGGRATPSVPSLTRHPGSSSANANGVRSLAMPIHDWTPVID